MWKHGALRREPGREAEVPWLSQEHSPCEPEQLDGGPTLALSPCPVSSPATGGKYCALHTVGPQGTTVSQPCLGTSGPEMWDL